MGFVFVQKEYFHFNRKSSIKQENPQYCEPFRNKVLRFKTSKVNRMNRIILTKTIVLTKFVFHLKNLSAVCTDDTHKNGRLFRGGSIYIYIYVICVFNIHKYLRTWEFGLVWSPFFGCNFCQMDFS